MVPPIVRVTLQSTLLAGVSNILGQLLGCRQSGLPYTVDTRELAIFMFFSILASPPNFTWQSWLEATFPGYGDSLTTKEKEKLVDETLTGKTTGRDTLAGGSLSNRNEKQAAVTTESAPADPKTLKKKLNIRNTAIKFLLDQTVGAGVNNTVFCVGIPLLRGYSWQFAVDELRSTFWSLIFAGQKVWPAVCLINLTVVPLEYRMLVGSLVGIGWGVFLTLASSNVRKMKEA